MLLFLMAKARKSFDALSELHAIITDQVRARVDLSARTGGCVSVCVCVCVSVYVCVCV